MVGRIQLSEIKKVDGGVGWGKTPTKPQIQRPICAALLLPLSITIYGIRNRTMRRTIIENSSSSSSSSRSVENIFPSFYFFCPLFFFFFVPLILIIRHTQRTAGPSRTPGPKAISQPSLVGTNK